MRISDMSNNNYHISSIQHDKKNIAENELSIKHENTESINELPTPLKPNDLSDIGNEINFAVNSTLKADKLLIGSTSNLATLDITKAMSEFKRDKVLHEYSYFINEINPEDGFVVKKTGTGPN